jgi:hypothetical protein
MMAILQTHLSIEKTKLSDMLSTGNLLLYLSLLVFFSLYGWYRLYLPNLTTVNKPEEANPKWQILSCDVFIIELFPNMY